MGHVRSRLMGADRVWSRASEAAAIGLNCDSLDCDKFRGNSRAGTAYSECNCSAIFECYLDTVVVLSAFKALRGPAGRRAA